MNSNAPQLVSQLGLPSAWVEELSRTRHPAAFGILPEAAFPLEIALSYAPTLRGRLDEDKIALDDVAEDLSQGCTLEEQPDQKNPGGKVYWLRGRHFATLAKPVKGRDTGSPLALVLVIGRNHQLERHAFTLSVPVRFVLLRAERPCDLPAIRAAVRLQQQRVRQAQLQEAARSKATDVLTRRQVEEQNKHRSDLHARARQRYGALRTMVSLLEQRANVEQSQSAQAVVIGHPPGQPAAPLQQEHLLLTVSSRDGSFDEGMLVSLRDKAGGTQVHTRIVELRNAVPDGEVLVVERPGRGNFGVGTAVDVAVVPKFGMKHHSRCLGRFLREEVEGAWEHIAALLCRPASLRLEPPQLPERFFCDSDPDARPLNEEQRRAVAGALTTPHAFFIQGPPGTGKTTVICELVQQLVERGERVLLLAPTHVAVDEVLRRIGHRPGVFALRLSWDDSRVRDDLQCFIPANFTRECVRQVRRPETSREGAWQARRSTIASQLDQLARLHRASAELAALMAELQNVTDTLCQTQEEFALWTAQQDDALGRLSAEIVRTKEDRDNLGPELHLAMADEKAALATWCDAQGRLAALSSATERLQRVRDDVQAAKRTVADHQAKLRLWRQTHAEQCERVAAELAETVQSHNSRTLELPGALQAEVEAERTYRAAVAASGRLARTMAWLGLGALAKLRRTLGRATRRRTGLDNERQRLAQQKKTLIERQQALTDDGARQEQLLLGAVAAGEAQRLHRERELEEASEQWSTAALAAKVSPTAIPVALGHLSAGLRSVVREPELASQLLDAYGLAWIASVHENAERARARRSAVEGTVTSLRATHERLLQQQESEMAVRARGQAAFQGNIGQANAHLQDLAQRQQRAEDDCSDALRLLHLQEAPPLAHIEARQAALLQEDLRLQHYIKLEKRWFQIAGLEQTDRTYGNQIAKALGQRVLNAANLICATTTGVAGSPLVRGADFDTLIVDEASRVTDAEFLIGAVRTRRWILVGDEHQLPPYVEQADEHHLHALAALHRAERGAATDLSASVHQLAEIWREDDEELRQFREDAVLELAQTIDTNGSWRGVYRETFAKAHSYFCRQQSDRAGERDDPDRIMLQMMKEHLVRSLFERCVRDCFPGMRQRLIVQRRMIEPIAAIVRDPVYGGDYQSPSDAELRACGVLPLVTSTFTHPIIFLDTSLQKNARETQHGNGFINLLECEWIAAVCRHYEQELGRCNADPISVSVLCFYRGQAREVRRRLGWPSYRRFRKLRFDVIDAVDKIQGQESDLVIISFCRTHPRPGPLFGQWLQDVRRLNVACTRAHRALVFVGHRKTLQGLKTVPAAQQFYSHLLERFQSESDAMRIIEDFTGFRGKC